MGYWTTLFYGSSGDRRREGKQNPAPSSRLPSPVNVTFDSAMSVSAFWASARLLTEAVAAMPIRCFDTALDTNVKKLNVDYELWRLVNFKPNSFQTRTEYIESLMMGLVTWGNAYSQIVRNARGKVIALIPLVSSQMEVCLQDGELIYVYHTSDGNTVTMASASVWHIKLFGNGIIGMSALAYGAQSIGIAIAANNRVSKLAQTGGKATGVLTIDQALTEKQREAVKANFAALEQGDADELFVLEAGFKWQQTSLSPADMQLLENRRFQIEDIARFMGVPSVLINDTSATTTWGSGIEQITQGFYKLNLRPYLERIESSIVRWLMPEKDWGKVSIEFDFDALLRADKTKRLESQAKAVNSGLLTPNEGRAEEGREPKDGGDDIYLNGTLVKAGSEPEPTQPEGAPDGMQAPTTDADTD